MDTNKKIKVQILNAFVDNQKGGNPAGVVLNADHLSNENKLAIAAKVGLSETAFVSKSDTADFKLDFFTPNKQIAHCGHATVATFSYLKQLDLIQNNETSKETIDGNRAIKITGDLAFMEQRPPKYINVKHKEDIILKSLGLNASQLLERAPIQIVNTGNSFMLIPVKNRAILKNLKPDFELINQISETFDLIGYYVFSTDAENQKRDASTRMFGPRFSIMEEAGTGMAAGPLACYLYDHLNIKKDKFLIQQGEFMTPPSPSLIRVNLKVENNKINSLMAGGKGMLKSEIEISI